MTPDSSLTKLNGRIDSSVCIKQSFTLMMLQAPILVVKARKFLSYRQWLMYYLLPGLINGLIKYCVTINCPNILSRTSIYESFAQGLPTRALLASHFIIFTLRYFVMEDVHLPCKSNVKFNGGQSKVLPRMSRKVCLNYS